MKPGANPRDERDEPRPLRPQNEPPAAPALSADDVSPDSDLLRSLLQSTTDRLYFKDLGSRFIKVSTCLAAEHGLDSPEEAIGKTDFDFFAEEHARLAYEDEQRIIRTGEPLVDIEEREGWKDGRETWVRTSKSPLRDSEGRIVGTFGITRDITAAKAAEDGLHRAENLEAIGHLTAGIAHDFNNLLLAVLGYIELARADGALSAEADDYLGEAQRAGQQAATLTKKLLSFGREQMLRPETVDLNELVRATFAMLSRVLGEQIEIELVFAEELATVFCDPAHMEQMLVNLALNARDAMPQGGHLVITTTNTEFDDSACPPLAPGRYVELTVRDDGTGMSTETLARIFEPFFTTKGVGEGTGLGLASAYGTIKQSLGEICVESELGQGTAFHIYLPALASGTAASAPDVPVSASR